MSEAERQKEYIRKAARLIQGRGLKYCTVTFGCQMNEKDSEKLSGILEEIGYERTGQEENADLILYNTCTVRENADQRLYGRLGSLKGLKKEKPGLIVCLCGCMMQESHVVEKIQTSYPYTDVIFGTHNIYRFPELLFIRLESGKAVTDIWEKAEEIVEDLPSVRKYTFKSGVNIMYGCDNFCSYCIVPYVRGRERSREPKEILREVEKLSADGVREVMLLGQNVNSYGKGLKTDVTFARLLEEVSRVPGIGRVRFMTSHPKDLSDELIETVRKRENIARHIHLPLQSGSDRILAAMNRHYTKEQYIALAKKLRDRIPDVAITTDIIVGFPGETKEDVDDTLDVIRSVRFDGAFTFEYSKRTGTPAASLPGQVPKGEVQIQFDRVLSCVQETAREQAARFEGRVMEVLVEGVNEKNPEMYTGRISRNQVVHFPKGELEIGQFAQISLDECCGFYYNGHMVCG